MNLYTKRKSFFWQKWVSAAVLLAVLVLLLNAYQSQIRNYFYVATTPIAKTLWTAGNSSSAFIESFVKFGAFSKENNDLKSKNEELLLQLSFLQSQLAKIQATTDALNTAKENNFSVTSAQVIGLDSANDFLLINKGLDDGIVENMPVISSSKILYGKVIEAYKNFSRVMLISNINNTLDVKILGTTAMPLSTEAEYAPPPPIYGAVKGSGNLSVYLDLVSSDVQIKEGDVLVTSALEGLFPRDLLIGKIISKNQSDLKPFQTAKVQPFFNINNIENLFVITSYMQK